MTWLPDRFARTALGLCLACLPAGDATAQERAAEPEVFAETIDVRVVNVDVVVTDKNGNPVSGLTVDDFELREDGRPVTIGNFYEYVEGLEVTESQPDPTREQQPQKSPRGEPGAAPSEVPSDQRLSLMVYIDQFNLTPQGRSAVLPILRDFLTTKLRPGDQVMLATYANRSAGGGRPTVHYRHRRDRRGHTRVGGRGDWAYEDHVGTEQNPPRAQPNRDHLRRSHQPGDGLCRRSHQRSLRLARRDSRGGHDDGTEPRIIWTSPLPTTETRSWTPWRRRFARRWR